MPSQTWPTCPDCGSEAASILHEANPDAESTDATLECEECGRVFKDVVHRPEPVEVDCIISEGAESRPTQLELPPEERIRVDDEIFGEGHRLLITGLETDDGRRVRSATPEMLGTVWCKVFDTVNLDVSVNQGHRTWTGEVTATPEEEFLIGDELDLKWGTVELHAIKTNTGVLHEASANARGTPMQARNIKRLYAKAIEGEPLTYDELHRTPGRDRQ